MRADMTGAAYAIYWTKTAEGKVKQVGSYTSPAYANQLNYVGLSDSWPAASASFLAQGDASKGGGGGPVGEVLRSREAFFVEDATSDDSLPRKELAAKYLVGSIHILPWEDGVVEYGTCTSLSDQWKAVPDSPIIPKAVTRRAFEEIGALYVLFWKSDGENFRVNADYETPASVAARLRRRGDGISFPSLSKELALPVDGQGPVAQAMRTGEELVVGFDRGFDKDMHDQNGETVQVKRQQAAKDFGIRTLHFVPFDGGVIEFGVSSEAALNDVTLDATLKMQCEAKNAAYAIYWKHGLDGKAVVAGSYISPTHAAEVKQRGKDILFADVKRSFDASGSSPVAEVLRKRQIVFVEDAKNSENDVRFFAAREYGIESQCFKPVLGGVLEFGTSAGTATWKSADDAVTDALPKSELEKAFRGGATYAIYWKANEATDVFDCAASFETNAQKTDKTESYVDLSAKVDISVGGKGPVALTWATATTVIVADTKKDKSFKRSKLAQDFGVGAITFVPTPDGVLEYGTVTRDRREFTIGDEYQETSRKYRRTVFVHDNWPKHRSTQRFKDTLQNTLASGIVRTRYQELGFVAAVAAALTVYNGLVGGFMDLEGTKQAALIPHLTQLTIPISLFTLTSPTLGLLLVFRTNACYARWDDSRKLWGDMINKCRSLGRQANTFVGDEYPGYGNFRDWRRRISAETSAFTRCLRAFLRGAEDNNNLRAELKLLGFTPGEVEGYMGAGNRQCYALQQLGHSIRKSGLDSMDRARMDSTLSSLCDDVGACERIFKTPIPLVYTRHTSRYVGTWLALLPFGIYGVDFSWNHLLTAPSCVLVTFFLLGIEELGIQIEEPFSILPMEAFCDASIGAVLNEQVLSEDKSRASEKSLPAATTTAVAPKPRRAKSADKPVQEGVVVPTAMAEVPEADRPGWWKKFATSDA